MHFRYFCAGGHYRNKLNFTFDSMKAAKTSYERLLGLLQEHKNGTDTPDPAVIEAARRDMREAVLDDLNIPKAMGTLWTLCKTQDKSRAVYDAAMEIDQVLGLRLDSPSAKEEPETLDGDIKDLVQARQEARQAKNFAEADRIRDELKAQGIELMDTKDGVVWKRV